MGFWEVIIIGVVALLVIGPKQLPEVARVVGRLLGEFKRATEDLSGGLLDATREVKTAWQDTQEEVRQAGEKTQKILTESLEGQEETSDADRESPDPHDLEEVAAGEDGKKNTSG